MLSWEMNGEISDSLWRLSIRFRCVLKLDWLQGPSCLVVRICVLVLVFCGTLEILYFS